MLNFKSLIAVAAITTVAMASIAQAAGNNGRKTVQRPKIFMIEKVRGSHAEILPALPEVSYQATHGLSAPAGRS